MSIIKAVDKANDKQKEIPVKYLKEMIGDLYGLKVCVLGAAFKPNTDDIREASSVVIVNKLIENGCNVNIYDPIAIENIKRVFGDKISYYTDKYDAVKGCDAVIVVTEWNEIIYMDWERAFNIMSGYVLVDGRNCLIKNEINKIGFKYRGI